MTWDFIFSYKEKLFKIHGSSHIKLNDEEKIVTNFGCINGGVPRCRVDGKVSNSGPFGTYLFCKCLIGVPIFDLIIM